MVGSNQRLRQSQASRRLVLAVVHKGGKEEKFQTAHWIEKLKDKKFKTRVLEIMDEQIIRKFDTREGSAEDFYDVDKE